MARLGGRRRCARCWRAPWRIARGTFRCGGRALAAEGRTATMRDAPTVRRWFAGLALLDQLDAVDLDMFAEHATWVRIRAGERLHAEGQDGLALWFLVEGEIVIGP